LFTKFENAVKALKVDITSWKDFQFNDLLFYNYLGLEPFQMRRWEIIFGLFARRWFTRLWVLQEVVLGNLTNFIIGHHILEFELVSLTVLFLILSKSMLRLYFIVQGEAAEDSHGYLAERDIRPHLLTMAYILEEYKVYGPNNESYIRLVKIHCARDRYERYHAYLAETIELSRQFNAQDPKD